MPGVCLLEVESPEIARTTAPGQFVMLACDKSRERLLRRPVSIYGVKRHAISFLFAIIGAGTEWLAQRRPGEKLNILGPLGNGFIIEPASRNLLLIAGGLGVAPLCFLAQEALEKGLSVKMLLGAKTACQLCPPGFIPPGTQLITATEDGTAGEKALVTALLPQHINWADQIFACGPVPMSRDIASRYSRGISVKPVQVSLEVRMGCGLGFCYACTIKTRHGLKQVCKDGPVFPIEDIAWEDLK